MARTCRDGGRRPGRLCKRRPRPAARPVSARAASREPTDSSFERQLVASADSWARSIPRRPPRTLTIHPQPWVDPNHQAPTASPCRFGAWDLRGTYEILRAERPARGGDRADKASIETDRYPGVGSQPGRQPRRVKLVEAKRLTLLRSATENPKCGQAYGPLRESAACSAAPLGNHELILSGSDDRAALGDQVEGSRTWLPVSLGGKLSREETPKCSLVGPLLRKPAVRGRVSSSGRHRKVRCPGVSGW